MITGVGGQGVVLIGNILREYGIRSPIIQNVVGTETRGVSQREGSVAATARYLVESKKNLLEGGYSVDDLISPLIPINDAHLVLGLEPLETLRNLKYVSKNTVVILNTHRYYPRNVITGSEKEKEYPSNEEIINILNPLAKNVISKDFNELSKLKLNNSIFANIIVLGVGVKEYSEIFDKGILKKLLSDFFEGDKKNIEAFELGYNLK